MTPFTRVFAASLLLGFAGALAQAPQPQAKPIPLSQEQRLQIENDAKDVKLAEQQIELLRVQLVAAAAGEQRSAQVFNQYLAQLRTELNAPANAWDFDATTLSFVPKGYKPPASTTAAPAGTPAKTDAKAAPKKSGGSGR